jgi:hypothetical protein
VGHSGPPFGRPDDPVYGIVFCEYSDFSDRCKALRGSGGSAVQSPVKRRPIASPVLGVVAAARRPPPIGKPERRGEAGDRRSGEVAKRTATSSALNAGG